MVEEIASIRDMEIEWNRSYTYSVHRGYIVELFDRPGIFQAFKDQYWPNGDTEDGKKRVRRYSTLKREYEEFLSGNTETQNGDLEEEDMASHAFAYEADLRDYLARNLAILESRLTLFEDKDRDGVEYPIEGGRIDILARDHTGGLVVIELKVSRGRNPAIGQLAYYMGWVDKHLAGPGRSRGIIVANEVSDDLKLACERLPDVSLYEYALAVTVEKVHPA